MNPASLISAAVITAVVLFGPAPADAQHSHRGGYRGHVASPHIASGPVQRATHIGRHAAPRTLHSRFHVRTRVAPHLNIHRAYRPFVPALGVGFGYHLGHSYPFYGYRTYGAYPLYPYRSYAAYPLYGYGSSGATYSTYESRSSYGSVRLDIPQRDAEVYVDGYYAGTVGDFDGTVQPLQLEPGVHRIEVQAAGYEPLTFEVNMQSGRDIIYRRDLRPLSP